MKGAAAWKRLEDDLRSFALSLPEAWEDFPWDEPAAKVRKKIFAMFGKNERDPAVRLGLSVKLPASADAALTLPWAKPTGYNLGKSGWVSLTFRDGDDPDPDELREWIAESYAAVAPKSLARRLDENA